MSTDTRTERDPVSAFTSKWAGVPLDDGPTGTMQRIDLQRLKGGKAPLTESQTQRAIEAATTRKPVTPVPERDNPFAVWSNLTGDITDLVKGIPQLPMALVNEVRALPTIMERASDANSFGDLAQLPGVRLIPGSFTASALLPGGVPAGEVLTRPVSTVLDVLPFASTAGKINAGNALTRAGIDSRLGSVPAARIAKATLKSPPSELARADRVGLQTAVALGEGRRFIPDLLTRRVDPRTGEIVLRPALEEFRATPTGQRVFSFSQANRNLASRIKRTEAQMVGGESTAEIQTLKDLEANKLGRQWQTDLRAEFGDDLVAANEASRQMRQVIADPIALGFTTPEGAIAATLPERLQPFARRYLDELLPELEQQRFRDFGPLGRDPFVARYDGEVYLRAEAAKLRRADDRLSSAAAKLTGLNPDRFAARLAKRTGLVDPQAIIRQANDMFPDPLARFAYLSDTFGDTAARQMSEFGQLLDDRAAAFRALQTGDPTEMLAATRNATSYRRVSEGLLSPKEFSSYAKPITELRAAAKARQSAQRSIIPARFTETGKRLFYERSKESYDTALALPPDLRQSYLDMLDEFPPGNPGRPAALRAFRESVGPDTYRLLQYRRPDTDLLPTPLSEETFRQNIRTFVDDGEINRIDASIRSTLNQLRDDGYQPTYVPGVAFERAPRIDSTSIRTSFSSPDFAKRRTFDYAPQHADLGVSVSYTAFQDYMSRFAEPYMANQIKDMVGINGADLLYRLEAQGVEGAGRLRVAAGTREWDLFVNDYINLAKDRGFVVYDPAEIFPTQSGLAKPTRDLTEMTFIPSEMESLIKRMFDDQTSYFQRLFDPISQTFRTSVLLFSPAWHFNNVLSGALLTAVTNPSAFLQMRDQWTRRGGWGRMLSRKDALALPANATEGQRLVQFEGLMGSLENDVISLSRERGQLENSLARTRTVSRIWNDVQESKAAQGVVDRFNRTRDWSLNLNAFWDDLFRAANFEASYEKVLKETLADGVPEGEAMMHAAERALERTQTIFMDWTQMLPVERGILRAVFPFYAWSSHVMRLAFKLPFDHPARVAVINNFTRAELEDWQSEFPQIFRRILGFADPETADRFVGLNVDAFNPFRDVGNILTMGGMVAMTNPMIQQVFRAVGVDPMSGGPEYAPNFVYDPSSPSGTELDSGNPVINLAGSIVPQARALARWAGMDEEFRSLERTNPAAAQRMLLSGLRVPIVYRDIDVDEVLGKEEIRRFNAYRKAAGEAKKGDGGALARFDPALAERLVALTAGQRDQQAERIGQVVEQVEQGNPLTAAARLNVEAADEIRGTQPLLPATQFVTV